MNANQIKRQFHSGRVLLTKWELFRHYLFKLLIFFYPFFEIYQKISVYGRLYKISLFETGIVLLAAYFMYYQYRALEFGKYRLAHTARDFRAAVISTAVELDWKILQLEDNYAVAFKPTGHNEGLRITILRENNIIFSNCMIEPSLRFLPFSYGSNKENIRIFNNNLLRATRGEEVIKRAREKVRQEVD